MAINALHSYDRFRNRIGILRDAYDITRNRRVNADYTLTFSVPMSSADFKDKLPLKGHVTDERGQYYVINKRQRNRDDRKLTAQIACTHVMYKLADYKFPYASYIKEGYGYQITQLTSLIAAATGGVFSISVEDTFDLADVKEFGGGNCLEALNTVINLYGAEVEPDNFVIHLRKKIGNAASDYRVQVARNLLSASFTDDGGSLCTRLFAEMKDSLTWIGQPASILTQEERARLEAIPGAITGGIIRVNYLVSPYASAWASDTVPFYDDLLTEQDVTDPLKLLAAARLRLAEREVPALEVSVSAADLHKLDAQEARPGLGDTVTLVDPALGLTNITARITEMTEYPFAPDKHTQLTVANVMRRDYAQIVADLEAGRRAIENVFSGGRIRAEAFEAFAAAAVKDIDASKSEIIYDTRGIVLQEKDDPNVQMVLTSHGLVISEDGGQTAQTAVTGRGISAPAIVGQLGNFVSMLIGSGNNVVKINPNGISAGHADFNSAPFRLDMAGNLIANSLTANYANILSSKFADGEISYGTIRGTEIIGATIRTATDTRRIVLDADGFRSSDASGTTRISIDTNDNFGTQEMRYYGPDGSKSGVVSGSNGQLNIAATPPNNLVLAGANVVLGGDADVEDFPVTHSVAVGSGVNHFDMNYVPLINCTELDQLTARVATLESELAGKASSNHSHTVNLGTHNHGITGASNWGGSFSVS